MVLMDIMYLFHKDVKKAAELMEEALRRDELHPDLHDQFAYRSDVPGCHRYFVEPYKSLFGPMVSNFIISRSLCYRYY